MASHFAPQALRNSAHTDTVAAPAHKALALHEILKPFYNDLPPFSPVPNGCLPYVSTRCVDVHEAAPAPLPDVDQHDDDTDNNIWVPPCNSGPSLEHCHSSGLDLQQTTNLTSISDKLPRLCRRCPWQQQQGDLTSSWMGGSMDGLLVAGGSPVAAAGSITDGAYVFSPFNVPITMVSEPCRTMAVVTELTTNDNWEGTPCSSSEQHRGLQASKSAMLTASEMVAKSMSSTN